MKKLLSLPENIAHTFNQLENKDATEWFACNDPTGVKVGSGGGSAHLLQQYWEQHESQLSFDSWITNEDKCLIHGGGQSRRLPAYAASGKLLTPTPVSRFKRGESLDQNLLDLQLPLYTELLEKSGSNLNCLIACGDVLLLNEKPLPPIPEADVVCVGLWSSTDSAVNHGVFFCPKDKPETLDFMLQKPSQKEINDLASDHLFLIDSGLWLLSPKAQRVLMKKAGWDHANSQFSASGLPQFYDLYSEMGAGLGTQPKSHDPEVNALTCSILILDEAQFLHFGSSQDLLQSTYRLQNTVLDQKKILSNQSKPHPEMFLQNSSVQVQLTPQNHKLWIENSYIPADWTINSKHVITGIPQNQWAISLPTGICLDFIPISEHEWCIRPYGINDAFRGALDLNTTHWLNQSFIQWLEDRKIALDITQLDLQSDIQSAPLFPVVTLNDKTQDLINWLINPTHHIDATQIWLSSRRLSADQIQTEANLTRLWKQRKEIFKTILPSLASNHQNSVFYQVDLEKLATTYLDEDIALPELPANTSIETNLAANMFTSQVLKLRDNPQWQTHENKAFEILRQAVIQTKQSLPQPKPDLLEDQIIWGRSPIRLDLAGGWTDTPPYCIFNGGQVVNLAVDLNGQPPIQVFARRTTELVITIRSIDLGQHEVISDFEELNNYNQVGSGFAIPKAALTLAGFSCDALYGKGFNSLSEQLKHFGGGIEISLLSAIPKGSGLGTSSVLATTVLGVINDLCNFKWDKMALCQNTLVLEQMLTTGGGWQDQFGGAFQGIKYFKTTQGLDQTPSVRYLPDHLFTSSQNKERILLYYTGITRVAKNILSEIVRGMFLNSSRHLNTLKEIGLHAESTYETILQGNYEELAEAVEKTWQLNQKLDSGTNTPEIQALLKRINPHLIGKKLLGAGGGGYLLIFAKDEKSAQAIKDELQQNPPNPRARFVDISLSTTGLQVTRS